MLSNLTSVGRSVINRSMALSGIVPFSKEQFSTVKISATSEDTSFGSPTEMFSGVVDILGEAEGCGEGVES